MKGLGPTDGVSTSAPSRVFHNGKGEPSPKKACGTMMNLATPPETDKPIIVHLEALHAFDCHPLVTKKAAEVLLWRALPAPPPPPRSPTMVTVCVGPEESAKERARWRQTVVLVGGGVCGREEIAGERQEQKRKAGGGTVAWWVGRRIGEGRVLNLRDQVEWNGTIDKHEEEEGSENVYEGMSLIHDVCK